MNLLASFLPGVRALRAPFAAGALGLLAVWLAVEPHFASVHANTPIAKSVRSAYFTLSPAARAGALAFAAYLLGSLIATASELATGMWLRNAWFHPLVGWLEKRVPSGDSLDDAELHDRFDALRTTPKRQVVPWQLVRAKSRDALRLRQLEWRLVRFSLLTTDTAVYGELDRLEAEGEFRVAVGVSVIALGIALATRRGPYMWWMPLVATGTLGVALLLASVHVAKQVEQVVVDLIKDGRIPLPFITTLEKRATGNAVARWADRK